MATKFQVGNKETKLLTKYENVTQRVLLFLGSILPHAKQLQHMRLS
jgi:hypothetical protein